VPVHKKFYYAEKIRDFLTKEGFAEVYTYSLRDKGELEIKNPLASDKNFVRENLEDGINGSLDLNEKNMAVLGLDEICIFEIGNIFKDGKENTSVGLGVRSKDNKRSFEILKEVSKKLTEELCQEVKIVGDFTVFEFNLDKILESLPEPKEYDVKSEDILFSYKPFSLFPSVLRDIAVWVPEKHSYDEVLSMITETAGEQLVQSSLFDEYKKDSRVSYAFKLVFQSPNKNLIDEEVNVIMDKITEHLNAKEGFEVR